MLGRCEKASIELCDGQGTSSSLAGELLFIAELVAWEKLGLERLHLPGVCCQWDLSRERRVLGALLGRRELLLLEGENARQGLLGES